MVLTTIWDKSDLVQPLIWQGDETAITHNLHRLVNFLHLGEETAKLVHGDFLIAPKGIWFSIDDILLRDMDGSIHSVFKNVFRRDYYKINGDDARPLWTSRRRPTHILLPISKYTRQPSERDVAALNGFYPSWEGGERKTYDVDSLLIINGRTFKGTPAYRDKIVNIKLNDGGQKVPYHF